MLDVALPAPATGTHGWGGPTYPITILQAVPGGMPVVHGASHCVVTAGSGWAEAVCPPVAVPGALVTCDGVHLRLVAATGFVTATGACGSGPVTSETILGPMAALAEGPGGPWGSDWPFRCRADFGLVGTGEVGCEAHVHVLLFDAQVVPLPGGLYAVVAPDEVQVWQESNGCAGLQQDSASACGTPDTRVA